MRSHTKIQQLFFVLSLVSGVAHAQDLGPVQVIVPVEAGRADGGSFFPLEFAFDGSPTWDAANEVLLGDEEANGHLLTPHVMAT